MPACFEAGPARGVIGSSSERNPGIGRHRAYSVSDVVKLAIMGRLSQFGIPGNRSAEVARLVADQLVRDGAIDWNLHFVFCSFEFATEDATDAIVSNPGMRFRPVLADARGMPVSDFTEGRFRLDTRRVRARFPARPTAEEGTVDPQARDRLAQQGQHAEAALIVPIGEIVNGVLLQLDDLVAKKGGKL